MERLEEDEVELSLGLAIGGGGGGGGGLRSGWQREPEEEKKLNKPPVIGEEIVAVRKREIEVIEAAKRRQEARRKQQLKRGAGGGCRARNSGEIDQQVAVKYMKSGADDDVDERVCKRKKNCKKVIGGLDLNSIDQSCGDGGEVVGFDSVVVCAGGEVEAEPLVPVQCPVPGMKYVPVVANRTIYAGAKGVGFRPFQGVEKKAGAAMENDGADGKVASCCSSAVSENSRLCSQGT